jgi:hypothetical protein
MLYQLDFGGVYQLDFLVRFQEVGGFSVLSTGWAWRRFQVVTGRLAMWRKVSGILRNQVVTGPMWWNQVVTACLCRNQIVTACFLSPCVVADTTPLLLWDDPFCQRAQADPAITRLRNVGGFLLWKWLIKDHLLLNQFPTGAQQLGSHQPRIFLLLIFAMLLPRRSRKDAPSLVLG